MRDFIDLFRIRRDERRVALVALLALIALNAIVVCHYYYLFTPMGVDYWKLFIGQFRISGFDPITYAVVSDWAAKYNVYRHPLLAFFMYLPYLLNQGLMSLTGANCALFIVAAMLVFAAFWSFMFLVRIFRDVVGISLIDASLLSALCFSFAYVMLSAIVPDHFILSMFMLLMVLCWAGMKIKRKSHFTILETIVLFVFTAGISLNNGLKVFLAAFLTNWRKFLRPKYLLLAVVIPSALIWLFARWEYRVFVWPEEMARKEAKAKRNKQLTEKIYRDYADTARVKDSASIKAGVKKIVQQRAQAKYKRDHQKPWNKNAGKPIAQGEFMRWTDISTPRLASTVENLFGESIQLHQDHLLQDVLKDNRPVIVPYRWVANYVVEGIIALLFVLGIICGWRSRFLWTALAFFAFDVALHVGLGFGLNEVYIMSAHWLFVVPLAMGYLFKMVRGGLLVGLRCLTAALFFWLMGYNLYFLLKFMMAF